MTPEPGTLACTPAGGLVVHVEAERYRIAPEDVRSLIFSGRPALGVLAVATGGWNHHLVRDDRGVCSGQSGGPGGGAPPPRRLLDRPARQSPARSPRRGGERPSLSPYRGGSL